MSLKRRHFLMFLGVTAGAASLPSLVKASAPSTSPQASSGVADGGGLSFRPVKGPMPYDGFEIKAAQQAKEYGSYVVKDELVLPEGFTYDVIGSWGDTVGDSRFGYNNDYLSFVQTGPNEGYLTINFEYISPKAWAQAYEAVVGEALPMEPVMTALASIEDGKIDASSLPDSDSLKAQIQMISEAALTDQGLGVISIRRQADGRWFRVEANTDRRITGISGLEDRDRALKSTGPATAIFNKTKGQGYSDGLGSLIIGSFGNCAGGTTPWGSALSAEENIQNQVPEAVYADGSSFMPSAKAFDANLNGQGNVLGLAGNKYGWIVEVDPSNPNDYGTKHTWLGRFRHEAVGVRVETGRRLAFYSGDDRRGGHVYKYVSRNVVIDPQSKTNSRLLTDGMLYAAKLAADGTGRWIALESSTPVDPVIPSTVAGGMITLPKRPEGGFSKVESDAAAADFKRQYAALSDLYEGDAVEKQGAILIDAHFAANSVGATNTARPEDTMIAADGSLYITFTSGGPGGDGGPDITVFQGPNGETPYEHGWIMKLMEDRNDPAAMTFRWEMLALGGEPADGGWGFSNPDNLELDANGNLWMVTDMSTSKHNVEVASRIDSEGNSVSQSTLRGLFGNNSIWFIPTTGSLAGKAYMFGYGPMECEMTGPFFTQDQSTLFMSAQHPGETHGRREDLAFETRKFAMKTTNGEDFIQSRQVPIGSNWPGKEAADFPKPSVVAIRRLDGEGITG
ncbi:MAG: DUF839 domain-containing protein [Leptolyngbyaceae cyanobacterium MO_188.B28]|nr:DUF839 domain-containing protein [Leptolyngbyaceae cyanobacterium MO_188.B28]